MTLSTTEDLGFQVLASSPARPTWAEGAAIASAAAAAAVLSLVSKARAEQEDKEIEEGFERYKKIFIGAPPLRIDQFAALVKVGLSPDQIMELEKTGVIGTRAIERVLKAIREKQGLEVEVMEARSEADVSKFLGEYEALGGVLLRRASYEARSTALRAKQFGLSPKDIVNFSPWIFYDFAKVSENSESKARQYAENIKRANARYKDPSFWHKIHSLDNLDDLLSLDLGEAELEGVVVVKDSKIDREETAKRAKLFREAPHHVLETLKIPRNLWWKWSMLGEKGQADAYALAAARGGIESLPMENAIASLTNLAVHNPISFAVFPPASSTEYIRILERLSKSGKLRKIDKLVKESKTVVSSDLLKQLYVIDKFKLNIPDTFGELQEAIAIAMGSTTSAVAAGDPQKPKKRFFDRLAQMDPAWAISEFKDEYERGKRIAPVVKDAVDYIVGRVQGGDTVFIHGRDGELLYELIKQRKDIDLSKVRYGITSRPLTTQAKKVSPKYMGYLKRVIPENAVHIDTGFVGSIPKWLKNQGFPIKDIKMVSATDKSEEIPRLSSNLTDQELRNLVLGDLEHSSQRLEVPQNSGFDALTFSDAAPGFWARFYGVIDALQLPKARLEETTRFERRFRVATEPSYEPEDLEVDETSKMKK